jgi:hypothetical protein
MKRWHAYAFIVVVYALGCFLLDDGGTQPSIVLAGVVAVTVIVKEVVDYLRRT